MRKALAYVLLFFFLIIVPAWAQTIRLAVVTKPGSAQNVVAGNLAGLVKSGSDGRYSVKILHSGQAGNETEILEKIRTGALDMAVVTGGPFDRFDVPVGLINTPFLFRNYAEADAVLQGPIGDDILQAMERAGFIGLAFGENGFRNLSNSKRPVKSPADLKGLTIRVMESPIHEALWNTLGARAVPMPWPIAWALKTGQVDGQENPVWVMDEYQLYEVQKYLTLTRHVYSPHLVVASPGLWNSLDKNGRAMVRRAAREAAAFQRGVNRTREASDLEALTRNGMEVEAHPDTAAFERKCAPVTQGAYFKQPQNAGLMKRIRDLLQSLR